MNNQLRVTAVLLGALMVAVIYTFPFWQQYTTLLPGGGGVVLACLPPQANDAFMLLENDLRTELLTLADEDMTLACELTFAQLSQGNVVPAAQQEMPADSLGRIRVANGNFQAGGPGIRAEGALSIFELADGRRLLRIDDLNVPNAPAMELYLSGSNAPATVEDMEAGGTFQKVGDLEGNIGSQNYLIASDLDLSRYNSVVIFSAELNIIVSYAQFILF